MNPHICINKRTLNTDFVEDGFLQSSLIIRFWPASYEDAEVRRQCKFEEGFKEYLSLVFGALVKGIFQLNVLLAHANSLSNTPNNSSVVASCNPWYFS